MSERIFEMRLSCGYSRPDNTVGDLRVETLAEGEWKPLDLNEGTPGFLIFTYAVFTCQHLYMRTNCAERSLMLSSAEGTIRLVADEAWRIQQLQVAFDAVLESGDPSKEDIIYISGRMGECPVSKNLLPPETDDVVVELRLT